MNERFLTVKNIHDASCGKPPKVNAGAAGGYTGYFENGYGEQWVLQWRPTDEFVCLHGGDIGWDHPQNISLPPASSTQDAFRAVTAHLSKSLKIMLNEPEQLWLAGCMMAIARRRKTPEA